MRKSSIIKTTLATLVALACTAGASHAQVIKITDDATLQERQGERFFSQSGISGEKTDPIETAGADMSLSLATNILVPKSWNVKTSGNFEQAVVSWSGGLTWPNIMYNIAQNEGIYINLDWVQKIISINVPGSTRSESVIAKNTTSMLKEDRQAFRKKQRVQWGQVEFRDAELDKKDQLFENMIEKQKMSQKSNQEFISRLNGENSSLKDTIDKLNEKLELEKQARLSVEEKYSVIDPTLVKGEDVDAVTLFEEFNETWVKPLDSSFLYYKNGGFSDRIQTHTPATYIAKRGSVKEVLNKWAEKVGWYVEYSAGVSHDNPYQEEYKGSFIESSRALVSVFIKSDRPLDIQFYPNVVIDMEDGTKRYGLAKVTDYNFQRTRNQ